VRPTAGAARIRGRHPGIAIWTKNCHALPVDSR
jgi:hypothetical protein